MRKLVGVVVLSLLAVAGCGVSPSQPSDPDAQHEFTRDTAGRAVPASASVLADFQPAHGFDHSIPSEPAVTDSESLSCSGACDANTCVCFGDLDCCIVGCVLCWEVID
jgi:hypothetical protein